MLSDGETAPVFSATSGTSDHESFDLDDHLGNGSVVLTFSLATVRETYGIELDLVSDMSRDAIREYDLETDIPELGLYGIANRAVFNLGETGTVNQSSSYILLLKQF